MVARRVIYLRSILAHRLAEVCRVAFWAWPPAVSGYGFSSRYQSLSPSGAAQRPSVNLNYQSGASSLSNAYHTHVHWYYGASVHLAELQWELERVFESCIYVFFFWYMYIYQKRKKNSRSVLGASRVLLNVSFRWLGCCCFRSVYPLSDPLTHT